MLGQFEAAGASDRFVWIRAFVDMASRRRALAASYEEGEAWKRHGPLANEIMRKWDDVYLLGSTSTVPRVTAGYQPGSSPAPVARPKRQAMAVVVTTEVAGAGDLSSSRAQELSRRLHVLGVGEVDRFTSEPSSNELRACAGVGSR